MYKFNVLFICLQLLDVEESSPTDFIIRFAIYLWSSICDTLALFEFVGTLVPMTPRLSFKCGQ